MPDDDSTFPEADSTFPEGDSAADGRDARVAALLAVEPLDDVTRRRLVSTAMRSTGSATHARRLIGAAAAVVALVVGAGVVVAVGSGSDSTTPSAARDKTASLTPQADGAQRLVIEDTARGVGDFGDLGVAANVDRLRRAFDLAGVAADSKSGAAVSAPSAAGTSESQRATAESSDALVSRLRALGCSPSALPRGKVVALASGTLAGSPVIVVDLVSATGSHSVHAITLDTCTVTRLS
jgi:hypothetical protein